MEVGFFFVDLVFTLFVNNFLSPGPVINIKKAISKLKEDISHLNLEVGLLNYSLDQDYLRQASIYAEIESNG